MENYLENVAVAKLEINADGGLKQNVRNTFRAEFMEALLEALTGLGLEAKMTEDGIGINVPNIELGAIPVVVSATVKSVESYILDDEHEAYLEKVAEKAEKEAEKERLKAQKLAEKEAAKTAKPKKLSAKK